MRSGLFLVPGFFTFLTGMKYIQKFSVDLRHCSEPMKDLLLSLFF